MKLTFDEAIKYHRSMWNWIAGEYEKEIAAGKPFLTDIGEMKIKFIDMYFTDEKVKNDCFCCEYASQYLPTYIHPNCATCSDYYRSCPLKWNSYEPYMCEHRTSPYAFLVKCTGESIRCFVEDMSDVVDACLTIANLEVNEDARYD